MNSEQKELFRLAILRVLDANRTRYGLSQVAIAHHLGAFSFGVASFPSPTDFSEAIADELQYLTDKHLVEECLKVVSRENRAWRITQQGIGLIDQRG